MLVSIIMFVTDFVAASKEFVADLISKAKEVDLLIRALPVREDVGLKVSSGRTSLLHN